MADVYQMTILVAKHTSGGHHADYLSLFVRVLGEFGGPIVIARKGYTHVFSSEPILVLMVEADPMDFFVTATLRTILRKKTVGLVFRAAECLYGRNLRHTMKRLLLNALARSSFFCAVTLIPFDIDRRLREIAKYGIYDPQLWDLSVLDRTAPCPSISSTFAGRILRTAGGRMLVVALGYQTRHKGFDTFCKLWCSSESSGLRAKFLFVAAGKIDSSLRTLAEGFRRIGGITIDRHMLDDELAALYQAADLVWSCYSPDYNQASGIFGRAVQNGVPTIVRKSSYIACLAKTIGHPTVELQIKESMSVQLMGTVIPARRNLEKVQQCVTAMYSFSTSALRSALGIPKSSYAAARHDQ